MQPRAPTRRVPREHSLARYHWTHDPAPRATRAPAARGPAVPLQLSPEPWLPVPTLQKAFRSPGLLFQEMPTVVASKRIRMCKFESALSPFGPRNLLQVAAPPEAPTSSTAQPLLLDLLREIPTVTAVTRFKSTPWLFDSASGDPCGSSPSNPYPYSSRTHQDGERDFASLFQDTAATESSRTFTEDGGRQYAVGRDVGGGRPGLEPASSSCTGPLLKSSSVVDGKEEHRQQRLQGDDLVSSVATRISKDTGDARLRRGPEPGDAELPAEPRQAVFEDSGRANAVGGGVYGGKPGLHHASSSPQVAVDGKEEHRPQHLKATGLGSSLSLVSPVAAGATDVRLHRRLEPEDGALPARLRGRQPFFGVALLGLPTSARSVTATCDIDRRPAEAPLKSRELAAEFGRRS
uniref:Uncharacterized protein n=1 Tax=Rhipicephalus zambeziensis TaxID=60191 RepID=A0A224YHW1_9ACAR